MPLVTNRSAIVHLIGFPGAGKLTIAAEIGRLAELRGDGFVVIDNHRTSNAILAVLDLEGAREVPRAVWDMVGEIREIVYRAIEELSPARRSFVFTNVLTEQEPNDHHVVDRLARLAANRESHYIPVRITCELEELIRRATGTDRRERLKWTDQDLIRDFVTTKSLLRVDRIHRPLDLDVTALTPEEAARQILVHVHTLD